MAEVRQSPAADSVTVQLLDAAQGHVLQAWHFNGTSTITIGRNDDNDVVIADSHVSRSHATLKCHGARWTLVSVGRHGTLVNDRLTAEAQLESQTIFRLGANGPTLRFVLGGRLERSSETIDSIQPDLIAMLAFDEARMAEEVEHISGDAVFRDLLAQTRLARSTIDPDAEATSPDLSQKPLIPDN